MEWLEIIIVLTTLFLLFYYWSTSTFDFWKSRGIAGPSPIPLFGNLKETILGKISFSEYLEKAYKEFRDETTFGIFMLREPVLVIVNPELIKDVLIKDFTIFPDRGMANLNKAEPLTQHLSNLEPARWRPLRNKLSPVFNSLKIRKMFHLVLECGQHLEDYLETFVIDEKIVECCELTAKFTTDVIGKCVFGLQMNALIDEESEFRKMGREIFERNWKTILRARLLGFAPWLYTLLGPLIVDPKFTNFFTKLMLDVIDHRKNNQIVKHDFIDIIMELRDNPDKVGDIELTDTLLAAQLFIFFVAGFDTSSTTMSNFLYELAQHQSIQDRLRDEINEGLAKNDGQLSYDVIKSMKYLDMVFKETLRKYPPGTSLIRRSAENYKFAGTKLTIPKGTMILVPVIGIHRDSRIYPNPEIFDPERFTEEAKKTRHPMHWLTFGDGPRNCIGGRFGTYLSKVGLIKILHRYKIEICEKTQIPYPIDPHGILLIPKNGIYLKISKVEIS